MTIQVKVNPVSGSAAANVDLSDQAFGAEFNEALIHQVVTAYQAGGRSGTRAQKNRAAVSGGGAKPWRQKGTGRARAGTIRSPIFTGGGRAFPASTQDFSQKVNRKMYRAAMRSILSELNRQDRLVVVDQISMDAPKTSALVETLASWAQSMRWLYCLKRIQMLNCLHETLVLLQYAQAVKLTRLALFVLTKLS